MVSKKELLTVEQVGEMFGYTVKSIKSNFPRTAAAIEKKFGVNVLKVKQKGKTYYTLDKPNERALTIFDESKDLYIPLDSLQLQAFEFYILFYALLAILGH